MFLPEVARECVGVGDLDLDRCLELELESCLDSVSCCAWLMRSLVAVVS